MFRQKRRAELRGIRFPAPSPAAVRSRRPTTMPDQATEILRSMREGDEAAPARLLPLVYAELRRLAGAQFRHQPADHTLQATALVHEAWLRLVDQTAAAFNDRQHFFAVAATAMRQILTDHARRVRAAKRGGDRTRIALEEAQPAAGDSEAVGRQVDVVALDEALTRLATLDQRRHRVVELRYFGGLTMPEIAEVLGVSLRTVESDWRSARAWLLRELQ